jgi:hypothetical protein
MDLHCHPVLTSQKLQDQNIFLQNQKLMGKVSFLQFGRYCPKILVPNALLSFYSLDDILFSKIFHYKKN